MIHLDLTDEEVEILRELLDVRLSDLRMEMADTDTQDYREVLKERKRVLEKTLVTLGWSTGRGEER